MKKSLLASGILLALIGGQANAVDFSFTGNLADDDDVQLFSFAVGSPSTVTLRTWSYAGGTNAAGDVIAAGGFDPVLALFDSTGFLIDQNDDGSGVPFDPVTGSAFDTLLDATLGAGSYTVAVSQYANFAVGPNLSDGFSGSLTTNFEDVNGDFRTSAWAFDILNVDTASIPGPTIPEPAAIALFGLGLAGLGIARRRTKA